MDTIQMFIYRWMDKQNVGYTVSGILFIFKKEIYSDLSWKEILTHATIWMNLEDILLKEISQSQNDKYCDSTYKSCLE